MDKVTIDRVKSRISNIIYHEHNRSIVAVATLKCGHVITGEAHCQPCTDYSLEIGKNEAYNRVIDKLFDFEVYYERNKGR